MIRYIFIFTLFFIANICVFSQTKSKKSAPKKPFYKSKPVVKKTTSIDKKTFVKPIPNLVTDSAKIVVNTQAIDSTKIGNIKKEHAVMPKAASAPVVGPIGGGPKSYAETEKKNIANAVLIKSKHSKSKSKSKNKYIAKWIKNNLSLGVRGGFNSSSIKNFSQLVYSGTNIPTAKPLPGYSGGIILNFKSQKSISFQPEILISQQGSQIDESMNRFKFRINYLKIPLLFTTNFGVGNLNYFISAGGYFGYAISKKSEREIGGKILTDNLKFETEYDVFGKKDNRVDFGPVLSAGIKYKLQKSSISFDTRYEHGISDLILYKGEQQISKYSNGQNRVLSASIGFIYPF